MAEAVSAAGETTTKDRLEQTRQEIALSLSRLEDAQQELSVRQEELEQAIADLWERAQPGFDEIRLEGIFPRLGVMT